MFSDAQKAQLNAPLTANNVKARDQGGRSVSYIEGWHAIAEANRIFGFDAWSRQTTDLKCVSEKPREIGKDKKPGFGVTYTACVRITVCAGDATIIREGCGTGHGIDRDVGQAHESALKEAETDAMKRALMTFGNPFGLALYDKTQSNVAPEPSTKDIFIADSRDKIAKATDAIALLEWWNSDEQKKARRFVDLNPAELADLMQFVGARRELLNKPRREAA